MGQFLREDMQAGALGLSTGLEYDPGIYSSFDEVVALATIASEKGGRYISHVRSEDRWFEQAIGEIIEIGSRRGPAPDAQALYRNLSPAPPPKDAAGPRVGARPTKKERRDAEKLRGGDLE